MVSLVPRKELHPQISTRKLQKYVGPGVVGGGPNSDDSKKRGRLYFFLFHACHEIVKSDCKLGAAKIKLVNKFLWYDSQET
jgi:hypothetical protein